jgi:hypothetical protein
LFEKQAEVLGRPIKVIQKAATKRDIKRAMHLEITSVVPHEPQILQSQVSRDQVALVDVYLPSIDPNGIESGTGEFHRIPAFKAAEVNNGRSPSPLCREENVQCPHHGAGERRVRRDWGARFRGGPTVEQDVMSSESQVV